MFSSVPERVKLHLAMVIFQIGYAGNHIILRIALNVGTTKLVFLIYRIAVGLLLLSPFAYFLEKKDRPPLKASFVYHFFVLGLDGVVLNNGSYFIGLENTSPVFASTIENSVPAITFALAAIFRIEEVHLNRKDGLAKVFGTLSCVITLYQGPIIYRPDSASLQSESLILAGDSDGKNWTLGCLSLVVHCIAWASWIVLQAPVVKKYPARLSIVCYTFFFGLLQFMALAAFYERDLQAWKIHSQSELLCVLYSGVVASALAFAIQIWVVERGGPMLVAAYLPLQPLLAAVISSLFLSEAFSLGSIIGAAFIVAGLYLVVWGKNEDSRFKPDIEPLLSNMKRFKSDIEPLLSNMKKNNLTDHDTPHLLEPLMVPSGNS